MQHKIITGLRDIDSYQAKNSSAYMALLSQVMKDRLALIVQRAYRYSHKLKYTGNEMINLPDLPPEPHDNLYISIAEKINAGKYLELNFKNSKIKYHILKALRHNLISTSQLANAFILIDTVNFNQLYNPQSTLHQHAINDRIFFDASNISFATESEIDKFYRSISNIEKNQRFYFTFSLSELQILALVKMAIEVDVLKNITSNFEEKLFSLLAMCLENIAIKNNTCMNIDNELILSSLQDDNEKLLLVQKLDSEYQKLLVKQAKSINANPQQLDIELNNNIEFILSLYSSQPDGPGICITQDTQKIFDVKFIILPFSVLEHLLKCIVGSDAIKPHFLLGKIPAITMLEVFCKNDNESRPFELFIDGVTGGTNPHGFDVHELIRQIHDIYHLIRNSTHHNKDFVRHLISVIQLNIEMLLSTAIWNLVDLDSDRGINTRLAMKESSFMHFWHCLHLFDLLNAISPDFINHLGFDDIQFIIIVDMLYHSEKWQARWDLKPKELLVNLLDKNHKNYQEAAEILNIYANNNDDNTEHHFIFQQTAKLADMLVKLKKLIPENASQKDATIYAILIYRLGDSEENIKFYNKLCTVGFDKYFSWTRNSGLKLNNGQLISTISQSELMSSLVKASENMKVLYKGFFWGERNLNKQTSNRNSKLFKK